MKYAEPHVSDLLPHRVGDMIRCTLWLLAWLPGTFLVGCEKGPNPSANSVDPYVSVDERVLQSLDPYNPIYKLDDEGRVTHIFLEGKHVIPPVLDEVCKLMELEHLSLYAASITDDSLEKLHSLKKLRALGLGETSITPKGLAHLEKLESLQWVWLSRRNFADEQIEELKQKCPNLTVFWQ